MKNAPAEPSSRPEPVYNSTGAERTLGARAAPPQDPRETFLRGLVRFLRAYGSPGPQPTGFLLEKQAKESDEAAKGARVGIDDGDRNSRHPRGRRCGRHEQEEARPGPE